MNKTLKRTLRRADFALTTALKWAGPNSPEAVLLTEALAKVREAVTGKPVSETKYLVASRSGNWPEVVEIESVTELAKLTNGARFHLFQPGEEAPGFEFPWTAAELGEWRIFIADDYD